MAFKVQDEFYQPVLISVEVKLKIGRCGDLVTVLKKPGRQGGEMCVGNAIQPPSSSILRSGLPPANEEEARRNFLLLQQCDANKLKCLCSQPSIKLKTMFQPS